MYRKLLRCSIGLLTAIVLWSACSSPRTTPSPTPTAILPAPTATNSSPTATPTPEPPPPPPTPEPATPTPAPTNTPAPPPGQLVKATIPAPSLENNCLGEPAEKPLIIYLPPSYATTATRYPVVYFLPGYSTDPQAFTNGTFQRFQLQEAMDRLIAAGRVREMLIVIPKAQHLLGGSFYTNSPVTGNWEDFIVEDVVQYVDMHYRTLPDAGARGIGGHSMGGYGALALAMRHPDVFGAVYSLSPGAFAPEGLSASQMFRAAHTITRFLALETELAALSGADALTQLLTKKLGDDVLFTVNYGMAFAPNLEKNAPYLDYPYRQQEEALIRDETLWQTWEAGFGNVAEKIQVHREQLLQLTAIGIDWGSRDEYGWIASGCEYWVQQLTAAGIPHTAANFDGGHSNQLRERLEAYLLPFFSDILTFENE